MALRPREGQDLPLAPHCVTMGIWGTGLGSATHQLGDFGQGRVILIFMDKREITMPFLMNAWTGPGAEKPAQSKSRSHHWKSGVWTQGAGWGSSSLSVILLVGLI